MMDFLKAYPAFTMEQYLWELSVPMIRLMSYDATQFICLTDKQKKKYKAAKHKPKEKIYNDSNLDEFEKELGIL